MEEHGSDTYNGWWLKVNVLNACGEIFAILCGSIGQSVKTNVGQRNPRSSE